MNDEKLEKMLQDALTPDINDEEIQINQRVRKYHMKKIITAGIAMAACAALIVTANINTTQDNNPLKQVNVVKTINNTFALKANAAEITKDNKVPTNIGGTANLDYAFTISESDNDGKTKETYFLGTGFACEGDNIDKITYHINKGAFLVSEKKGNSILTDYETYTGKDLSILNISKDDMSDQQKQDPYDQMQVSSYTVDYDQQTSKHTNISICETVMDKQVFQSIFDESISVEKRVEAVNQLMKDFEINCTVTFKDGSTETKSIGIEGYKGNDKTAGFAFVLK